MCCSKNVIVLLQGTTTSCLATIPTISVPIHITWCFSFHASSLQMSYRRRYFFILPTVAVHLQAALQPTFTPVPPFMLFWLKQYYDCYHWCLWLSIQAWKSSKTQPKKIYYFSQSHNSTDEVRYREKYMLLNLRQWRYREQWPQNIKTKSVFQPLSCCVLGYFVLPMSQNSQSFCRQRCPGLCVYCIILLLLLFLKAPVITAESNCHNLKQPLSFSQNELDFLLLCVRMFRSGKDSFVHGFCLFVKRLHFLVVERESLEEGA